MPIDSTVLSIESPIEFKNVKILLEDASLDCIGNAVDEWFAGGAGAGAAVVANGRRRVMGGV